MPPCAATLCARRGLSWMQNDFTLYPSSASEAAAEAPANPVPTTMISYFRLLDGLTSLMLALCLSHFCGRGPEGILASSFMLFHHSGQHRDGDRDVTEKNQDRHNLRQAVDHALVGRVFQPERLKHRTGPVTEMDAEQANTQDIKPRDPPTQKTEDHHLIDIVPTLSIHQVAILRVNDQQ